MTGVTERGDLDAVEEPPTAPTYQNEGVGQPLKEASMGRASTMGLDIAKRVFPAFFRKGREHGLAPDWPITYEELAGAAAGAASWQPDAPGGGHAAV